MDLAAFMRVVAPYQHGDNDKVFEAYQRGLAQPDHDAPFHAMEAVLRFKQMPFLHVASGYGGAAYLAVISKLSKAEILPIPHACPSLARDHKKECKDVSCTHEMQCMYNVAMWLAPDVQKKMPYAARLSDHMAKHLIQEHLRDARDILSRLRDLLRTHGDIILKRWKKMSRDKRGKLLHEAALKSFPEWPLQYGKCGACPEDHFGKWPGAEWFNAKDLTEDWTKLVLALHCRTTYPLEAWAMFNTRQAYHGWDNPYAPLWYNEKCVVMHGKDYGSLCDFEEDKVHCWAIAGFPRAFLTIQAQHQIAFSLLDISKKIIEGAEGTGNAVWTSLVPSSLNVAGREGMLVGSYYHQALVEPRAFDPVAFDEKVQSAFDMIKDEIWLMQTEPAYMQEVIQSKRVVLSNNFGGLAREQQLIEVGTILLLELNNRFEVWSALSLESKRMLEAFLNAPDGWSSGAKLPAHACIVLSRMGLALEKAMRLLTENFESIIHGTKGMKGRFRFSGDRSGHLMFNEKKSFNFSVAADRLRWYITYVKAYSEGEEKPLHGLLPMLDQLFETEYVTEGGAELVDKPTHHHLCDLQTLDELYCSMIWSQLVLPGDREMLRKELLSGDEVSQKLAEEIPEPGFTPPDDIHISLEDNWTRRMGRLVEELMNAPWPKGRKDLAWHARATETRRRSRNLWKAIAEEHDKAVLQAQDGSNELRDSLSLMKTFDAEASFLERLEVERRQCEAESARQETLAAAKAEKLHGHVPQSVWGDASQQVAVRHKQTKAKAARDAASLEQKVNELRLDDTSLERSQHQSTSESREHIPVKKESLAVFRKMFPSSDDALDLKGDVRWQVFLQAMKDAGMTAAEASGSAVSFSNAAGSICFHRPHPDPVIDPVMLHNMARRMNKWFGWDSETFVLRT